MVASPDVSFARSLPIFGKNYFANKFFLKCYGTNPVALLLPLVLVTQYLYVRYMYGTSFLDVIMYRTVPC